MRIFLKMNYFEKPVRFNVLLANVEFKLFNPGQLPQ